MLRQIKGQSTAEYAILIGLIIAAIVAIQPYVKRTLQGKYKQKADAYVDRLPGQLAGLGEGTQPTAAARQFEFNEMTSQSTQNLNNTDTATMAEGGATTQTSNSRTSQESVRGYDYHGVAPTN